MLRRRWPLSRGRGRYLSATRSVKRKLPILAAQEENVEEEERKRRRSHLRTWSRFHVVESADPVIPVQPGRFTAVARAMRKIGYRSVANYMCTIKRLHIEEGHAWSSQHMLAYADATKIARRKLGPPKQSSPFNLEMVAMAYSLMYAIVAGAVVLPFHALNFTAVFMLRGLELAFLNCSDVSLDLREGQIKVAVRISSSKTDPRARGFQCRWKCTCGCPTKPHRGQAWRWLVCPAHIALDVAARLHGFPVEPGKVGVVGGDTPFFVTTSGGRVGANTLSKTLKQLHAIYPKIACCDDFQGPVSFGGHSGRRSGAQFWYKKGLAEKIIRRLARWRSESIELYLQQCPVSNLGPESLQLGRAESTNFVECQYILKEVRRLLATHLEERKEVEERPAVRPVETEPTKVLISTAPGKQRKVHRIAILRGPPTQWRTHCNFHFGRSQHIELEDVTGLEEIEKLGQPCSRGCFHKQFGGRVATPQ